MIRKYSTGHLDAYIRHVKTSGFDPQIIHKSDIFV
jgi:hypothetical protein